MKRAHRPKPNQLRWGAVLGAALLPLVIPWPAHAAPPVSSSYATVDGRDLSHVMACPSVDGTYTAVPCGVPGYPLHVTVDGGSAGGGGGGGGGGSSLPWVDASFTATGSASSPAGLVAAGNRVGLHVWNVGTATVCMNYTAVAQASGATCAPGSVPIAAGAAYFEDQPGNVSPEAISLVCAGTSCPLTIKVR